MKYSLIFITLILLISHVQSQGCSIKDSNCVCTCTDQEYCLISDKTKCYPLCAKLSTDCFCGLDFLFCTDTKTCIDPENATGQCSCMKNYQSLCTCGQKTKQYCDSTFFCLDISVDNGSCQQKCSTKKTNCVCTDGVSQSIYCDQNSYCTPSFACLPICTTDLSSNCACGQDFLICSTDQTCKDFSSTNGYCLITTACTSFQSNCGCQGKVNCIQSNYCDLTSSQCIEKCSEKGSFCLCDDSLATLCSLNQVCQKSDQKCYDPCISDFSENCSCGVNKQICTSKEDTYCYQSAGNGQCYPNCANAIITNCFCNSNGLISFCDNTYCRAITNQQNQCIQACSDSFQWTTCICGIDYHYCSELYYCYLNACTIICDSEMLSSCLCGSKDKFCLSDQKCQNGNCLKSCSTTNQIGPCYCEYQNTSNLNILSYCTESQFCFPSKGCIQICQQSSPNLANGCVCGVSYCEATEQCGFSYDKCVCIQQFQNNCRCGMKNQSICDSSSFCTTLTEPNPTCLPNCSDIKDQQCICGVTIKSACQQSAKCIQYNKDTGVCDTVYRCKLNGDPNCYCGKDILDKCTATTYCSDNSALSGKCNIGCQVNGQNLCMCGQNSKILCSEITYCLNKQSNTGKCVYNCTYIGQSECKCGTSVCQSSTYCPDYKNSQVMCIPSCSVDGQSNCVCGRIGDLETNPIICSEFTYCLNVRSDQSECQKLCNSQNPSNCANDPKNKIFCSSNQVWTLRQGNYYCLTSCNKKLGGDCIECLTSQDCDENYKCYRDETKDDQHCVECIFNSDCRSESCVRFKCSECTLDTHCSIYLNKNKCKSRIKYNIQFQVQPINVLNV